MPITPVLDFTVGETRRELRWRHRTANGQLLSIEQGATQTKLTGVYESSFVALEHPSGKWWESMFFPTSASGNTGFSITTWGKKAGASGSLQVKLVNCHEWYGVVATKIAPGKGYSPLAFIGRQEGVTNGQRSLFERTMNDDFSVAPMAATSAQASDALDKFPAKAYEMLASQMMVGMIALAPVQEFLRKISENNHSFTDELAAQMPSVGSKAEGDMAMGYAATITAVLNNPEFQLTLVDKPKEPEIDRSTVYDAWGAFG